MGLEIVLDGFPVSGFALAGKAVRNIMERSGKVWVAASLAQEIGFTDIDGKQPRPLTLTDI